MEECYNQSNHTVWSDESGATAIEYGLLASLIAVVIIGAVKLVATNLSIKFNAVANNLS
ncbi:MAG TPA: Flp family type IVb pilin [Beijerinckiaceae bacterium]|nr:Flp family type IVb pilin [Beijerinckiaceae bacterium]